MSSVLDVTTWPAVAAIDVLIVLDNFIEGLTFPNSNVLNRPWL